MSRGLLFADESGNFDFRRATGATKYFALTTVCFDDDPTIEAELLALRRDLSWRGEDLDGGFHCTDDNYTIRTEVFKLLAQHNFRVDATLFEKSKAKPSARANDDYFYKLCWYSHLKHVAKAIIAPHAELHVVAASLGTKKKRSTLHQAVADVVQQTAKGVLHKTACWSCDSDPCLQVADYCCWAIYRKWEFGDPSWYNIISSKVSTEYDYFQWGPTHYY